jgi:uncharacterized repeat protein (TIGR01451 family)
MSKNKKVNRSTSDFVEHPLTVESDNDSGLENLRAKLGDRVEDEDELLEIYEDGRGNIVDVKKINIRKKRGVFFRFFRFVFWLAIIGIVLYFAYNLYQDYRSKNSNFLELKTELIGEVKAGQEMFYTLSYKNLTNNTLKNIKLEVTYPDSFIYLESLPTPFANKNTWEISSLSSGESGTVKVKGKVINEEGKDNLFLAKANYYLDGFSTEFKQEISATTLVDGFGFSVDISSASTALVGDENYIDIAFGNYEMVPSDINFSFSAPTNVTFTGVESLAPSTATSSSSLLSLQKIGDDTLGITGFNSVLGSQTVRLKYIVKEKSNEQEKIALTFQEKSDDGNYHTFFKKEVALDVIKSALDLNLTINGNQSNTGVNFGDTLNYSISYSNKGEATMRELVIMAVLDSDFIDWNTFKDKQAGQRKTNTIVWTGSEVPGLKELAPGREGVINFSIGVDKFNTGDLGKSFQIKSYAQYSIKNSADVSNSGDNQSNVIINKINSDASLKEQILYFNDDNVPVGSGPLPPQVGVKTGLKVYWKLSNNLHELSNAQVTYVLPPGVSYDDSHKTSVGNLTYDSLTRQVTWQVGRLPLSVLSATAEFGISVTPTASDKGRIMVLSTGALVQALDSETQGNINRQGTAKTTRLEDDDIAGLNNDGRVE